MKAPRTRLADNIATRTLKSGNSKKLGREVAAYLLSEHRAGELDSLLRDIQAAWAEAGYVEVLARSAHPLDTTTKTEIGKRMKALYPNAKQVTVTEVHDPAVVGGVQLNLANQQLDLSVEAKLNKFKQLTLTGKE